MSQGADLLWVAAIDDQTAKFFDAFDRRVAQMKGGADSAFDETSAGANESAVSMGVLAGAIGGVTAALTGMALRAATALPNLIVEATKIAAQAEVTETALFAVSNMAGITTEEIRSLRDEMVKMTFSTNSANEGLLRLVGAEVDLATVTDLANAALNISTVLGKSEEEVLSRLIHGITTGQTRILQMLQVRVSANEVTKETIRLAKEQGVAVDEVNKVQARLNLVLKAASKFEGAYASASELAGIEAEELGEKVKNLKQEFGNLFLPAYLTWLQFMRDNVISLTAWFVENEQTVANLAGTFNLMAEAGIKAIEALTGGFVSFGKAIGAAGKELAIVLGQLERDDANQRFSELGTTARQALAFIAAGVTALATGFTEVIGLSYDLLKGLYLMGTALNKLQTGDYRGFQEQLAEGMNSMLTGWDRAANGLEKVRAATEATFLKVAEGTGLLGEMGEEGEDAAVKVKDATKDMTEAFNQAAAAISALNEKFAEQIEKRDIQRMRQDIDAEIRIARQREDLARNHAENLDKIREGAAQRRTDVLQDFAKEEQELAREQLQERIDLEQSNRDSLLDIETNYRRTLQDIQSDFEFDAHELARKNDAVGLLRLIRSTNKRIAEAKTERGRNTEDRQADYAESLADLQESQALERSEIQRDRQERLAELDVELQERLAMAEEQRQKNIENLERSLARQREDLIRHRQWQDEDLIRAHQKELAEMGTHFGGIEGLTEAHLQTLLRQNGAAILGLDAMWTAYHARRAATAASALAAAPLTSFGSTAEYASAQDPNSLAGEWGFARGGMGIATRPTTVDVGEGGAEAFAAMPFGGGVPSSLRLSGSADVNVNGLTPNTEGQIKPMLVEALTNIIRQVQVR